MSLVLFERVLVVIAAEEEEAGNVFISPLLTPAEDTFADYDDNPMGDLRRESMLPTSMTRSMTAPHLRTCRVASPSSPPVRPATWAAEGPLPFRGCSSIRSCTAGWSARTPHRPGSRAISRRLSSIFTRSTPHGRHRRGSVHFNPDVCSGSSGGREEGEGGVSRRASLFAESIFKRRKDRSKSLARGPWRRAALPLRAGQLGGGAGPGPGREAGLPTAPSCPPRWPHAERPWPPSKTSGGRCPYRAICRAWAR